VNSGADVQRSKFKVLLKAKLSLSLQITDLCLVIPSASVARLTAAEIQSSYGAINIHRQVVYDVNHPIGRS
jgi:hypothetical protein